MSLYIHTRVSICSMFDLNFHKEIKKILAWTEDAPGTHVLNNHQVHCQKKSNKSTDKLSRQIIVHDRTPLRIYVVGTYLEYFDLELKIGIMDKYPERVLYPSLGSFPQVYEQLHKGLNELLE